MTSNPYQILNRETPGQRLKRFVKDPSWLNRIVTINVAVFLLVLILRGVCSLHNFLLVDTQKAWLPQTLLQWLSCPASVTTLLHQPWSIFTSLFIHNGLWHLFFNMFMLYFVGKFFLSRMSERHFLWVYFLGGIVGNVTYIAAYNLFPVFANALPHSFAVGASGCIMAVMAAITLYEPNYEVNLLLIGRVKMWVLTLIFIAIDLMSIPKGNAGGHIAHIGGVLLGLVYVLIYRFATKRKSLRGSSSRQNTKKQKYYVSRESGRPISDEEYNERKTADSQRIDEILDKISKDGYPALTEEEKDFLFHYSKSK